MQYLNIPKNVKVKLVFLLLLFLIISCAEGTHISGASSTYKKSKGKDDSLSIDSKRKVEEDEEEEEDEDSEKDDFEYPKLNFKIPRSGENFATCREQGSKGTKPITADLDVELTAKSLQANMKQMTVHVKDHQSKADAETAPNTGLTEYFRPSSKSLKKLIKEDDFDYTTTAIFADKIVKNAQGQTFTFSAPLPVFAYPVPASRYDDLKTSKMWRATIDGGILGKFTAEISLKKVSSSDDEVVIELTTHIPEDHDGRLYEEFPVPKSSIFTLDLKKKRVIQIRTVNHFHPDSKYCKGGGIDRVESTYKLCTSEKDGEVEEFNCAN